MIGRLAADPESRTTTSGQDVVSLRLATNRVWTNQSGQKQEQVEFHSITLWGRLAQIASQYLKKGGLAMIEGRLQTRSWTGQDNVKRYRTEVVAENIQLGPRTQGAQESVGGGNYGTSQKFTSQKPSYPAGGPARKEVAEEEIPVINEDEPIRQAQDEPIISNSEIEEAEVDLKDIPF